VIYNKISNDLVTRYLRLYKQPYQGSKPDKATRLETYFQVQAARRTIRLSLCDICDAHSDSELPTCAFCGDAAPVKDPGEIIVLPARRAPQNLDEAIQELHECAQRHWGNVYRAGELLKQIRDQQLWRERIDERGKEVYGGYLEFVAEEVGIRSAYATRLVRIVENFSEEDVAKWGISRLSFAARLPENDREKFIKETAHIPTKNLPAVVKSKKLMDDFPEMSGKSVIAKVPIGRTLAKLYVKGGRLSRVGIPEEPAKSIEQRPFTMVRLPDDLWIRIDIKRAPDGSGDLVAAVQFRQGTEFNWPPE
jgi:hypothetical protein